MRYFKKLLFGVTCLFAFVTPFNPVEAQKTRQIENTHVTPHMDVPIEAGRNTLFCSTFQIAWNDMRNNIIKENIILEKPLDLVRLLNRGLTTRTDINEEDYLVMVGYGRDNIADKINRALKSKFGNDAPFVEKKYNEDDAILAYAFLTKELRFENAFEDFKHPMTFYGCENEARVAAFGIGHYSERRHRQLQDQVEIIDYMNPHDFIIRLKSKNPDDELILARVDPEKTLLETFEKVNWRITRSSRHSDIKPLGKNDILQIPKFDLSMNHTYSSLLGLHLLNDGFERYFVDEAKQDIRFKLDECGAMVKSEAIFALKKGPSDFRALMFNKPFMLYLKKKDGQYPYLAMWVENAGLMAKSD